MQGMQMVMGQHETALQLLPQSGTNCDTTPLRAKNFLLETFKRFELQRPALLKPFAPDTSTALCATTTSNRASGAVRPTVGEWVTREDKDQLYVPAGLRQCWTDNHSSTPRAHSRG